MTTRIVRSVTVAITLVLSACAARSTVVPPPLQPGASWVSPDVKNTDLVYISNYYASDVLTFTFPGGKAVGTIGNVGDPAGECTSSTSKGNWWVVASGSDQVLEFAHGGTTPIATVSVSQGEPETCSLDPLTGDLAVAILGDGDVVIFKHGKGSGATYNTGLEEISGVAYDPKGELFVDGTQSGSSSALLGRPKGAHSFETITLNQTINEGGSMQWYGKYLVIEDNGALARFAIHGKTGTFQGSTPVGASAGFSIAENDVAVVNPGNEDGDIYSYPKGVIKQTLSGNFDLPLGAVVSTAK